MSTNRRTLFLAMFALAMLALLPLRLVLGWAGLDDQGFAARQVRGSVWSGRLSEARFGDLALGDLDARVSPLALLIGRARVALESRSGGAQALSGTVELSRNRAGVIGATGPIEPGSAFAPLPVAALNLDEVSVRFVDGACEAAEGRVRAEIAGTFLGATLPGAVSGTARCDGGALLLPLVSAAGTEGAALRLWADGRYRAELTLVPSDPAVATRLDTAGFVANGAARMLAIEGRF
ncbi:type II secretion system protein N [Sphingomonas sp.]|uniref:type II secretion system protein N n=1 Tax=Sphingomonas sp. TaxID=28214 RepID=UPI0035C835AA